MTLQNVPFVFISRFFFFALTTGGVQIFIFVDLRKFHKKIMIFISCTRLEREANFWGCKIMIFIKLTSCIFIKNRILAREVLQKSIFTTNPQRESKKNSFPCSMGTRFSKMEGPLMKYWCFFNFVHSRAWRVHDFCSQRISIGPRIFKKKYKNIFLHTFPLKY